MLKLKPLYSAEKYLQNELQDKQKKEKLTKEEEMELEMIDSFSKDKSLKSHVIRFYCEAMKHEMFLV